MWRQSLEKNIAEQSAFASKLLCTESTNCNIQTREKKKEAKFSSQMLKQDKDNQAVHRDTEANLNDRAVRGASVCKR